LGLTNIKTDEVIRVVVLTIKRLDGQARSSRLEKTGMNRRMRLFSLLLEVSSTPLNEELDNKPHMKQSKEVEDSAQEVEH
jgi:hypothetical protein